MRCTAVLILLACIIAGQAAGTTYTVMPDGTGDFPTIQAALDAATGGDVIELADGTFLGPGNRDIEFLGKAVTVRSASGDPQSCVIDCEGTPAEWHCGFTFSDGEGPSSILEGVTVTGGLTDLGGGICCGLWASPTISNCRILANTIAEMGVGGAGIACVHGCAPHFIDCIIADNQAPTGLGGGVLDSFGSPTFEGCTFSNNGADEAGGGIFFSQSLSLIENCTFAGNEAQAGSGIYCEEGSDITLTNTIIAFGGVGEAAVCDTLSTITLSCCDLFGSEGGDWVGCVTDQFGILGNISEDPLFCLTAGLEFPLQEDSPCGPFSPPNTECDLIGAWPVGCEPVSSVPPGGYPTEIALLHGFSPNPCTGSTTITCSLPAQFVSPRPGIAIYDAAGRLVRTLSLDNRNTGLARVRWDGNDEDGTAVAAGRYFGRLSGIEDDQAIGLILVR